MNDLGQNYMSVNCLKISSKHSCPQTEITEFYRASLSLIYAQIIRQTIEFEICVKFQLGTLYASIVNRSDIT